MLLPPLTPRESALTLALDERLDGGREVIRVREENGDIVAVEFSEPAGRDPAASVEHFFAVLDEAFASIRGEFPKTSKVNVKVSISQIGPRTDAP